MTSSRKNKNRNSRRTPTATSTKRNFTGSMPLATSVNTPSTSSATPVQQASHVAQISDLPTLPNENNPSLEEQLKQQQLLIDKLTSRRVLLKVMFSFWKGKLQYRKRSVTFLSKKPTTQKLTPGYHAQFYQEFRNQRKSRRRISKHHFLKISRKLVYSQKKQRGTLTNFIGLEYLIMKLKHNQ